MKMRKKTWLLAVIMAIVIAALCGALIGCKPSDGGGFTPEGDGSGGGGGSNPPPAQNDLSSITLSNANAFAADIDYGSTNKTLEIALDNNWTLSTAQITVRSSNTDYVGIVAPTGTNGKYAIEPKKVTYGVTADGITNNAVTITVSSTRFPSVTPKTLSVKIAPTAPTVTVAQGTRIEAVQNSAVALPALTLAACDDTENMAEKVVVDSVTVTDASSNPVTGVWNDATKKLTAADFGKYNVAVTVKDTRKSGLTDSVTVPFVVWQKMFSTVVGDGTVAADAVSYSEQSDKQVTRIARSEMTFARLDTTSFNKQAATTYYAEVTFTSSDGNGNYYNNDGYGGYTTHKPEYGLGHSIPTDDTRFITSFIDRGASYNDNERAFKVKDFDMDGDADWKTTDPTSSVKPIIYQSNLAKLRGYDSLTKQNGQITVFPITVAVARVGSNFYSFFRNHHTSTDLKYINTVFKPEMENTATVPALFQHSVLETYMSDIVWLTGQDATDKLNDLLGANNSKVISPWGWENAQYTSVRYTPNGVADAGMNFSVTEAVAGENKNMVSPYIALSGDFTFSWEFKNMITGESNYKGNWQKYMQLEVRQFNGKGEKALRILSSSVVDTNKGQRCINMKMNSNNNETDVGLGADGGGLWTKNTNFDYDSTTNRSRVKYTLTRECTTNSTTSAHEAKFTLKIESGGQVLVENKVGTFTGNQINAENQWSDPWDACIMIFNIRDMVGEVTNITWSANVAA